ncbi:MAG: hypothetical protein ACTJIF_11325, partial [Corynebacterium variabile]|uniref:hypothetical protein n=1 Tax=Corynebacterium variabile TaxID=1727 RepID=UPI003F93E4F8
AAHPDGFTLATHSERRRARKPRGIRHRLSTLLAAAQAAVIAGRRSYISISRWIIHHINTDITDFGVDLQ